MWLISRRVLLTGVLPAGLLRLNSRADANDRAEARRAIAALERRHGGRIGVAILNAAGNSLITHRGDERFALCSTFKFLAAAFVLARVDRGDENLARRIVYERDYLVPYCPVTGRHADGGGLTVGEICAAAMILSDNTAANLLLDNFGGPAALTRYARLLGDNVTRLDRREPDLNEATPGDPRDTTSPVAMLGLLRETVLGTALSAASREKLTAWLTANKTGDKQLRAGVPGDWRVGDKTGSGAHAVANDIAVIWPPADHHHGLLRGFSRVE